METYMLSGLNGELKEMIDNIFPTNDGILNNKNDIKLIKPSDDGSMIVICEKKMKVNNKKMKITTINMIEKERRKRRKIMKEKNCEKYLDKKKTGKKTNFNLKSLKNLKCYRGSGKESKIKKKESHSHIHRNYKYDDSNSIDGESDSSILDRNKNKDKISCIQPKCNLIMKKEFINTHANNFKSNSDRIKYDNNISMYDEYLDEFSNDKDKNFYHTDYETTSKFSRISRSNISHNNDYLLSHLTEVKEISGTKPRIYKKKSKNLNDI